MEFKPTFAHSTRTNKQQVRQIGEAPLLTAKLVNSLPAFLAVRLILRRKGSRASQWAAWERPACLSTWMCEFGPARRPREAQGTEMVSSFRRVSGANGFGYFSRKKSDSRAQRVKALDLVLAQEAADPSLHSG
jgi:hypothetical protein